MFHMIHVTKLYVALCNMWKDSQGYGIIMAQFLLYVRILTLMLHNATLCTHVTLARGMPGSLFISMWMFSHDRHYTNVPLSAFFTYKIVGCRLQQPGNPHGCHVFTWSQSYAICLLHNAMDSDIVIHVNIFTSRIIIMRMVWYMQGCSQRCMVEPCAYVGTNFCTGDRGS